MSSYERYTKLLTDENLDTVERLIDYAEERGHTILELAISWLLAHGPVASVIAGATSGNQVRANVNAAVWELTPSELEQIDGLLRCKTAPASI